MTALRVLSGDLADLGPAGVVELARATEPDAVVLRRGPRRLRWRTRTADLANRCGLVYAGGGEPALGNAILVGLRLAVLDTWCVQFPLVPGRLMQGAVLARLRVGGVELVLAGTRLSSYADERVGQATALARVLAEAEPPVVLAADVADHRSSPAWRTLAGGLVDAVPADAEPDGGVIFVDPSVVVATHRSVRTAGGRSAVVVDLRLGAGTTAEQRS